MAERACPKCGIPMVLITMSIDGLVTVGAHHICERCDLVYTVPKAKPESLASVSTGAWLERQMTG